MENDWLDGFEAVVGILLDLEWSYFDDELLFQSLLREWFRVCVT
jgi:hypothetical protein